MKATRRTLLGAALATPFAAAAQPAAAQPLRIGVLTDMSGLLSDISGEGSVLAARMAVEDFGDTMAKRPIEILFADHQNKPDVGVDIARQWIATGGVSAIADVPTSSVALAVQQICRETSRIALLSGAGSSDLTGPSCSPVGFHWTYDTYALAKGVGATLVRDGGDSWFFMTDDYAFGLALERDTTRFVEEAGGHVVNHVRFPMGSSDFSSYLLQAQNSGAKVIGLATASGDTGNALKQAKEFGLPGVGKTFAGLQVFLSDVHAVGLDVCQNLIVAESFYWDMDAATRAWSRRFQDRLPRHAMPSMLQAGTYSAVLHYLRAVQACGTDDAMTVANRMRATPVNDFMSKDVAIRADGRVMRNMYVFRVKTPQESQSPWDYYDLVQTMADGSAFRPLAEGHCPLING